MKKNFVKKLALGLAVVMAVSTVNVPASAAAKKPFFKTASATVEEGETVKAVIKKTKGWKIKKVVSMNEEVAKVKKFVQKAKKTNVKITGVKAGETVVKAVFKKNGKKVKAKLNVTVNAVKVESVPDIKSLEAAKVNVLTATFASAVNTEDVTLAVTKGTSNIEATVAWNADKTVATITTVAKMTKGTYTLTATAASDSVSKTADVAVEDQTVAEIIIKDTVALTGKHDVDVPADGVKDAAGEAYVYYDVIDQYGESLKASTSITWSTSCGNPAADDRNLGKLTLRRSDNKAFTYGEQIFVTGVNAQTGKAVNATLTVGAEQALNNVEVKGFVKKNTTEILSTLPSGFKSGAYYMIYSVTDQNGNPMDADYFLDGTNASGLQQVTFISDNVLVIKEFTEAGRLVVIDGVTYSAANVVPGMYVDNGGEVNITAIANKTGNKSMLNTVVGEFAVLQSFVMSAPELIADGETKEIPFIATDVNGNEIKNFAVLADNINKLTFSTSDGTTLTLKENADGTATLTLSDAAHNALNAGWGADSTDGIDRPVALTAIVVGGETNNLMVNIKDKARPDAIYSVNTAEVIVEAGQEIIDFVGDSTSTYSDFVYLDQYGRKIPKDYNYNDNGFFTAAKAGLLSGIEFTGYEFGVKVSYKGNANAVTSGSGIGLAHDNEVAYLTVLNTSTTINADTKAVAALTGENLKFEIAKFKPAEGWNVTSTAKNTTFAVVDITQVKNLVVADLSKQYVVTDKSANLTGSEGSLTDSDMNTSVGAGSPSTTHNQAVVVTGTFNGKTVVVPSVYCDAATIAAKLTVVTGASISAPSVAKGAAAEITTVPNSGLKYKDLYDATTAKYTRKDTTDTLEVVVNQLYSNLNDATFGSAITPDPYDTVSADVTISDAAPVPATIVYDDTAVYVPSNTAIGTGSNTLDPEVMDGSADGVNALVVLDQYGKFIVTTNTYKVSKVAENEAGYAENNFKVANNGQSTAVVKEGAERGDTFVLTITAKDVNGNYVTKDVTVTVGADSMATIVNSTNNYFDTLVTLFLEPQRVAGLQ